MNFPGTFCDVMDYTKENIVLFSMKSKECIHDYWLNITARCTYTNRILSLNSGNLLDILFIYVIDT